MSFKSSISERAPVLKNSIHQIENIYGLASNFHVEGATDEFKSSPVRRTLCLIILIDLVICVLLWIIHLQQHPPLIDNLKKEVLNYTFNNSLFDMTVLSGCRFLYLEIAYGCVKSQFPWYISVSTLITSVFSVVKLVLNVVDNGVVYKYLMIILSFIAAWIETIFLIYRVLPKEKAAERAMDYYRFVSQQYGSSQQTLNTFSDSNLPCQSLSSSENEEEFFSPNQTRPQSPSRLINIETSNHIKLLKEKVNELNPGSKNWKYLAGDAVAGFLSYQEMPAYPGKVYKIECFLNVATETIYNDMVYNVENTHIWNPQVRMVKKIEKISENADIIYNISNEAMKGYISARDFVLLRVWGSSLNKYHIYTTSFTHQDYPPLPNIVRGDYGIGVILLERSENDLTKCIWIINYDVKVNIFRRLLDKAMKSILLEMIYNLKQHCILLSTSS